MNEVMNNILTRRSIRKFTDTPISREILDDLVQAALHAPSGMGKQTWKFTVVTNKNAIKRLAEAIKTTLNRPGYDLYCPAAIIIPSNLRDSNWGKEDDACALENIFLAANSYGVGSVWINQLQNICDTPAIRDILNDFGVPANHVVCSLWDGCFRLSGSGYCDPAERADRKSCLYRIIKIFPAPLFTAAPVFIHIQLQTQKYLVRVK